MIMSAHSQGIFKDSAWRLGDGIIAVMLGVGVAV